MKMACKNLENSCRRTAEQQMENDSDSVESKLQGVPGFEPKQGVTKTFANHSPNPNESLRLKYSEPKSRKPIESRHKYLKETNRKYIKRPHKEKSATKLNQRQKLSMPLRAMNGKQKLDLYNKFEAMDEKQSEDINKQFEAIQQEKYFFNTMYLKQLGAKDKKETIKNEGDNQLKIEDTNTYVIKDDNQSWNECASSLISNLRCKKPSAEQINWIQCEKCKLWFHLYCIGLKSSHTSEEMEYVCIACKLKKRGKGSHAQSSTYYNFVNNISVHQKVTDEVFNPADEANQRYCLPLPL